MAFNGLYQTAKDPKPWIKQTNTQTLEHLLKTVRPSTYEGHPAKLQPASMI